MDAIRLRLEVTSKVFDLYLKEYGPINPSANSSSYHEDHYGPPDPRVGDVVDPHGGWFEELSRKNSHDGIV